MSTFRPPLYLVISLMVGLPFVGLTLDAQTSPPLEFESASLQLHLLAPGTYFSKDYPHSPPFVIPRTTTFSESAHVQDLIMQAYGVSEYQIYYLPPQMRGPQALIYDLTAKAKANAVPTPAQFEQMMQSLLASRFHLKAHWETKPKFQVYALVPDTKGPKFHEFQPGDARETSAGAPFVGTTIFALAHFLSQNMDFPVIDGTTFGDKLFDFDIDGLVNFHEIDREQSADPMEAQDYLRSVVLHVLGLKMDMRKIDLKFLAIDHIEEPSAH